MPGRADAARVVRNLYASQIYRGAATLTPGTDYQFRTWNLGTGVDTVLHLLNPDNVEVAQNDDYSPPATWSWVQYTPTVSGTHYVVVRSYSTGSAGVGDVQWRTRATGGTTWSTWETFGMAGQYFGGQLVTTIQSGQAEYWTLKSQPSTSASPDTVLYTLRDTYPYLPGAAIVGFNDDGGAGYMSMVSTSTPNVAFLLVGSYGYSGAGYTDLIANDKTPDLDGDGLGTLLESELGTCDSTSSAPIYCSDGTLINAADTDHDGLGDKDEVLGVDWVTAKSKALHLWAWGANPLTKDVFIEQDWVTRSCPGSCWDASITGNPFNEALAVQVQSKYAPPDGGSQAEVHNPVGAGINLHFDIGSSGDPCPGHRTLCGAWGGGGDSVAFQVHNLDASRAGRFHHALLDASVGGGSAYQLNQNIEAGIGPGPTFAPPKTLVHELGHSLGLGHDGHRSWDDSPAPGNDINCKAHYNSLMNYTYDADWTNYKFSHNANPSVLDPARMSEVTSFGGYDASRLQAGYSGPLGPPTSLKFPIATSDGKVDWNRDNILVDTEASWVRGVLPTGCPGGGAHWSVKDPFTTLSETGDVSPDIAAFQGRLYGFYANAARSSILYRHTPHTGNSDRGGCSNGTGHFWTSCHTLSSTFDTAPDVPVTGTVSSVVAFPWSSKLAVAWRTTDRKVWVNAAAAVDGATGKLTSWGSTVLVASDADSIDLELSAMYVSTSQGYSASEVLAIFYTTGAGSSAVHKMMWTTNPLTVPWSARSVTLVGASSALSGDEAPGVAVWPSRSAVSGAPTYSSYGYACGYFPGTLSGSTRLAKFLCYDKGLDRWRDLTVGAFGTTDVHNEGRRPGIAFHMLRAAAPLGAAPDTQVSFLDESNGKGVFMLVPEDAAGTPYVNVSTVVSALKPPFDSTGNAQLSFTLVETSWDQQGQRCLALYGDRDVSSVKAVGYAKYKDCGSCGLTAHPEIGGIVDGAYHAQLKDGNDFYVLEQGVCRSLHNASPTDKMYCGAQGYWGISFP